MTGRMILSTKGMKKGRREGGTNTQSWVVEKELRTKEKKIGGEKTEGKEKERMAERK